MCAGIIKESLMARIGPGLHQALLQKKGCHEMDFTARPMAGFVVISPDGIDRDRGLDYWIGLAFNYKQIAKPAKKRSPKKKK